MRESLEVYEDNTSRNVTFEHLKSQIMVALNGSGNDIDWDEWLVVDQFYCLSQVSSMSVPGWELNIDEELLMSLVCLVSTHTAEVRFFSLRELCPELFDPSKKIIEFKGKR